jgi:preprotein translocase subunit Sec63
MGADYYKLLGVDRNANDDDIKRAYKKMVRQLWHSRIFEKLIPYKRRPSNGILTETQVQRLRLGNSKKCVVFKSPR